MAKSENYLVISDLQIPFEASFALPFCIELKKEFKIADENILCVGDEVDQYFGSLYDKDPNGTHTPDSELKESIDRLKLWYRAFPRCRVAESNHGQRWAKKACQAGIPSQMMRKYQEVLEAPPGWRWKREWYISALQKPFLLVHGLGYGGMNAHRQMALNNGMSTVHGHLHSSAGISIIKTAGLDHIWGMNVGCLIDVSAYAFHYNIDHKLKPCLGAGVILDGGRTPLWIPYDRG